MQVEQPPHTKSTEQGPLPAGAPVDAEAREHPAPDGSAGARVRHVLVWSA